MKIVNFSDSPSIISQYLVELRDVEIQKDRLRFRENVKRIGHLMAYEISKHLDFEEITVQSPLAPAKGKVLKAQPVIALVLRAGLTMHNAFLEVFDRADNCFISAYRDEGAIDEIKAHIEYLASPSLEGRTVILVDPMLATGSSLLGAFQALKTKGIPKEIHVACIVAAPQGIELLKSKVPEIDTLWAAALDDGLNEKAYIVPGLGDAGDLAFGEKL